jgi:predicted secreted protein
MAQQMLSAVGAAPAEAERRRRVRRTAIAFTLIAAGFYFGFIIMMLVRGSK